MNKKSILAFVNVMLILSALTLIIGVSSANSDSRRGARDKDKASGKVPQVVSTTLVLSQVYGGGGGSTGTYLFDYVEIKNISGRPQSLAGLSLYYGAALGTFATNGGSAFALPNATLNPGQYYLVQLGSTGSAGAPLPPPDAVSTGLNMAATSGKVALVPSTFPINACGSTASPCSAAQLATFIDWVAYGAAGNGTAGNGEGGTSVNNGSALTSSQGAVRKNGGCVETDNNNSDFDVLSPPIPRNRNTTPALCTTAVAIDSPADFNGDGRTDFAVTRNSGGATTWYIYDDTVPETGGTTYFQFGASTDTIIPGDFDGDGRDDITVWRPDNSSAAGFYIFQSQSRTVRFESFGLTGDNPTMVADYDGDGRDDPAVYRAALADLGQSYFYYRPSTGPYAGQIVYEPWGTVNDRPVPGDFDGDGRADFCIYRDAGGTAIYWVRTAAGTVSNFYFGLANDQAIPGNFDSDAITDIAIARSANGTRQWYYRPSSAPAEFFRFIGGFGFMSDTPAVGDYDGDGRTDIAVWRPGTSGAPSYFFVLGTTSGFRQQGWGLPGDGIVAAYQNH